MRRRLWRFALVTLLSAVSAPGNGLPVQCTATFRGTPSYPIGGDDIVAIADFNRDGKLDIAALNSAEPGATVSILLGNGDGTFQAAGTADVSSDPLALSVSDFDGDGKLDLAVGGRTEVSVLLGNGDGTFRPATGYSLGGSAFSLAVADFDGDGKLDIAVADSATSTIRLLLGNGDGTFRPGPVRNVAASPEVVVASDFNGDGKADLAVADGSGGSISILLGDGAGSFASAGSFPTGSLSFAIAIADFNGDGKWDLATTSPFDGLVTILLGNGDGTFQPVVGYYAGNFEEPVVAADFNGDGQPDLAVGDSIDNVVSILLNNGDGTFGDAATYPAGSNVYSLAAADLDGDGKMDLVAESIGAVSILRGDGHGGFPNPAQSYYVDDPPYSMAAADLNGDGRPDLAVGKGSYATTSFASILLSNGDGTFQTPVDYTLPELPLGIVAADLNGDGKLDIVAACGADTPDAGVSILLGKGDGTFQPPIHYVTGAQPASVAVSDFNRDGKPDLAVANYDGLTISILLGNQDGTFQAPRDITVTNNPFGLAAADFNADGKADLAVAISPRISSDTDSEVLVFLGRGDGTFQDATHLSAGIAPGCIVVADFDGDGFLDLAVANLYSDSVSILLGHGDGTFQPAQDYEAGFAPFSVAATDLNKDGKPDLAIASGGGVAILLNNGDATFRSAVGYVTGGTPYAVAAADFDGDGLPDLAVGNTDNYTVSILLNSSTVLTVSPAALPEASQSKPYSQSLSADGGAGTVTFSLSAGALPPGLSLSPAGILSGTPDSAGDFHFTVVAADTAGCGEREYALTIRSCRRCTRILPPRPTG